MVNQVFKGEVLSRTKVKNNILRIWKLCGDVDIYDWYREANGFAIELIDNIPADSNTVAIRKACGVIAALSPVKQWEQNKICAIDMIKTGDCGHMKVFKGKARRILENGNSEKNILEILKGRKISSFFMNILYPDNAEIVTIDRHALSVALGYRINNETYQGITKNQYDFFVDCYRLASESVSVSPALMQSATWVKFRKIKNNY